MMNKKTELEKAISAVKFRDDNQDKYVFDITANRRIGTGFESVDLIMKKSGADTLKRAADYAKENEFETLHIVLYKNKQAKEKITEYDIPLFESEPSELSGVNTPAIQQPPQNEADKFFQSFGGLSGFMSETRNQLTNQLDLQYTQRDLNKAQAENASLTVKNEALINKNDELREENKALKDKIHDLERDLRQQQNTFEQKNGLAQLVANGVVGFVGSQLGVTPEKLSGLLGLGSTESETPAQTRQQEPAPEPQQTESSEKQQYIDAIVEWLYSLDEQKIKLAAGIAQYAGQSTKHLAQVYEYCRTLQKQQNGTENNNDTD